MKVQAAATESREAERAEAITAQEKAPWRISKVGNMAWALENVTATAKYAVQFSGAVLDGKSRAIAKIDGYTTARIRGAFTSWQTGDELTVTWHRREDLSDEPLTWDGRLPKN